MYGGAYQWVDEGYRQIVQGDAYDLAELLKLLEISFDKDNAEITFFGDGIISYKDQIEEWKKTSHNNNIRVLFAEDDIRLQKASSIAKLALEYCRIGQVKNLYDLKPVYMRKAEAERKLEEKS